MPGPARGWLRQWRQFWQGGHAWDPMRPHYGSGYLCGRFPQPQLIDHVETEDESLDVEALIQRAVGECIQGLHMMVKVYQQVTVKVKPVST